MGAKHVDSRTSLKSSFAICSYFEIYYSLKVFAAIMIILQFSLLWDIILQPRTSIFLRFSILLYPFISS